MEPQMWQNPFVNIFKNVRIGHDNNDNKKIKKEGEVKYTLDETVRFWALKLKGHVSAKNTATIPPSRKESLDLHGRFMYVQLRAEPPKIFVLHVAVNTTKRNVVRFSISNMHKEHKIKGNAVELPCLLTQKWTVLALDLPFLLQKYGADGYDETSFLSTRSIQMCSTLNVRNIFTSDNIYRPDFMEPEMALKLPKGVGWHTRYRWNWVPGPPSPEDMKQNDGVLREKKQVQPNIKVSVTPSKKNSSSRRSPNIDGEYSRRHFSTNSILREELGGSSTNNGTPISSAKAALERAATVLEREGKSVGNERRRQRGFSPPSPPAMEDMANTLSKELAKDREQTLDFAMSTMAKAGIETSGMDDNGNNSVSLIEKISSNVNNGSTFETSKMERAEFSTTLIPSEKMGGGFSLRPDPIMELEAVVGFRGTYANTLIWSTGGQVCIFPSNTVIVMMSHDVSSNNSNNQVNADEKTTKISKSRGNGDKRPTQHLLFGHNEEICAIANSKSGRLLASAQEGKFPMIRLWRVKLSDGNPVGASCAAILTAHASGLASLSFSPDDKLLCAVGKDVHRRIQIIVWDVTRALDDNRAANSPGAPYPIVARQISEFDVRRIKFSPYEENNLVSVGRENIRFWRIRKGHLRGCPVVLNEYARGTVFTDVAYESAYGPRPLEGVEQKRIFASTMDGTVVQVNYQTKLMECVYRLHDAAIHSIAVNEGFCVTGSEDKYLRVWPLDFSDYFLEAQHEGPVQSVDVSPDGLKLVVGTSSGTLGVLDVSSHNYHTLLRSHTDKIHACALDPSDLREEFGTVSADGTIRFWSLNTLEQLYEFAAPQEGSRCIAYQPTPKNSDIDVHRVACGFDSGCVRIFDVPTTTMPHEYQQHRGPVVEILFDPVNGERLYSAGLDGHICVYDVTRGYQPVKMIASDYSSNHVCMCISPDGNLLASVGPDPSCAIIFSAESLHPLRKLRRAKRGVTTTLAYDKEKDGKPLEEKNTSAFRTISFNGDGTELIAATTDHRIARYDVSTGSLLKETNPVHRGTVNAIDISPSGAYIITAGDDRMLRVWDSKIRGPSPPPFQSFIGHASSISSLKFTRTLDGNINVVSVGAGNGIFIWKFYGVEELLADTEDESSNDNLINESSIGSSYAAHRTKRLPSPAKQQQEKFVGDDEEEEGVHEMSDPEDNAYTELGPGRIERLFKSGLATMINTCQQKGQMVHKFISRLQNIFTDIDTLNDGTLSTSELSETLSIMRVGISQLQLDAMIVCLDPDDSGRVDYEVFIDNLRAVAALQARSRDEFSKILQEAGNIAVENLQSGTKISPLRAGRKTGDNDRAVSSSFAGKKKTSSIASVANALGVEESSSGIELQSILGYTGCGLISSNKNVLWHPDSGLFGFVTGQAIVLEDLKGSGSEDANGMEEETTGAEQKILSGSKEEISLTAVSSDGRYVAGAEYCRGETGSVYVWSSHGNLLHTFRHEQGTIQVLQFDPSSKCLVTIGRYITDKVVIWDIASGTELCAYQLAPGASPIQAAKMLSSGSSVNLNGAAFKFLTIGQRSIKEWTFYESPEYGLTVFNAMDLPASHNAYPEYLTAIDCRPSAHHDKDNLVAVGGSAGTVWLFRTSINLLDDESSSLKFKLEGKFPALDGSIEHIQWRSNVSAIVVGGVSNKVKLIGLGVDAQSSPKTLLTTVLDGSVKSMTWEPNLKDGIIGTDAGSIWYISHSHGNSLSSSLVRSHTSNVIQVKSGSGANGLLASAGGKDGTIRVWHVELMQHLLTLDAPPSAGECDTLAFSSTAGANNNLIAGGFEDGSLWKYDISSVIAGGGKGIKVLHTDVTPAVKVNAHQSSVTATTFMMVEDTLIIVSGSSAGELSIHDGRFIKNNKDGSSTARPSVNLNSPHSGNKILSIETSPFDPTMFLVSSDNSCLSVWKVSVSGSGNNATVESEQVACSMVDVKSEAEEEGIVEETGQMAPAFATFSPVDSDLIIMLGGRNPCKIIFWQFENSLAMRTIDLDFMQFPTSLCARTNTQTGSHFIAIGCRAGNLLFMDYHSGEIAKCDDGIHGDSVRGICFLEGVNRLVTASQNNLHMWKFI